MRPLISGCFRMPVVCMAGAGSLSSACWVASLTLSSGGDKMGACRWARCCGDQAAGGPYRCLVASSGSAGLKGRGRPVGAEQPLLAALQLLQKLSTGGKFSL